MDAVAHSARMIGRFRHGADFRVLDLAAGNAIGIDYTGTLTAARGTLTVAYIMA